MQSASFRVQSGIFVGLLIEHVKRTYGKKCQNEDACRTVGGTSRSECGTGSVFQANFFSEHKLHSGRLSA